jgi:hypothetical protein
MSGATLAEFAAVLGHKTLAMVKRYAHLSEPHTSAVVSRMNERFLGVSGIRADTRPRPPEAASTAIHVAAKVRRQALIWATGCGR